MRIKKNIIVWDTETVGDFNSPLIHDFGYCVLNENLEIVKKYRALVKEIRDCNYLMNSEFYKSKEHLYTLDIINGKVEIKNWLDIVKDFKKDISNYNIKTICAYNVAFDKRALESTCSLLHGNLPKLNYLCIWDLACRTILDTDKYREFAKQNNLVSEKGNYLTSAESCFKYMSQNLSFEEDHTALSDSIIESAILKYIVDNYKGNSQYGAKYNCWKKVQD